MRYALISGLAFCAVAAQALPQATQKRKIPCKTPENATSCFWTRGRLNFYNGAPSYRVWKIGTKRILGVYSGPDRYPPRTDKDSQGPEFPAEIDKVFRPPNNTVYANFEICPLEPERKGEMQAVCIESASNIAVEGFNPKQRSFRLRTPAIYPNRYLAMQCEKALSYWDTSYCKGPTGY